MADTDIVWVPVADIVKRDKNADGSITVTGVISSPKPDLDRQVMDNDFLKRAATDWFTKRANIREMHQPLAVGKGKELIEDKNGLLVLTSKIIEPSTVKKVDEGVLSAYSVGIKNPRVVRDASAPNGRIVDGTMVECSLVDYPAAEVGKFTIAKAASPDEDTGAIALTEAELVTLDETLIAKKAVSADEPVAPAADSPSAEATKAADNPSTGSKNLTPDELRAAALSANPAASEADLAALVSAYEAITTPNQAAGGIKAEVPPPHNADTDPDAGESATAADKQQARAADEDDGTAPTKISAEQLLGSIKAALADTSNNEIRTLLADTAKAAVADQVKAAVEEAQKGLVARLAKLEKSPAPSGPFVGPASAVEKVLRINDSIEGAGVSEASTALDPVRVNLLKLARSDDRVTAAAAREALAAMTPNKTEIVRA